MKALSPAMVQLLDAAGSVAPVVYSDGSVWDHGTLVSGRRWRTALALEKRGLVVIFGRETSRGWVKTKGVSA
jgi:hypothetical protein